MKKALILYGLLLITGLSYAQLNRTIFDKNKNQEIAYGECTEDFFKTKQFSEWFLPEYEQYKVKKEVFTPEIRVTFDSIYVFMASWCSDTQRELPRFCKIIDEIDLFRDTKVVFFALDSDKKTDVINSEDFYIQYVPTFVFYFNGQELCRIVEEPRISLEEDMLDLLQRIQ